MIAGSKSVLNEFQMRLTLNGNKYFPDQEILVDGEVINTKYAIDYLDLVKSTSTDGELDILTCGRGFASCAGLEEGIKVSHSNSVVTWRITDPKPERLFQFDENQYFASIVQFFRAADAIKEVLDDEIFNIGSAIFTDKQFADCLRQLESLMDDTGNLMETHFRHIH